jgi:glycosyltransferase involved in cell wall biosynthesis
MNPLVSIIITTRNEEKHIAACLESIHTQTYPSIETIIVDNNSKDKTKNIVKKFDVSVFNIGPERSAQRNFGARKAKGEYLLFLDADMILTPIVIGQCVRVVKQQITNNRLLRALVIPEKSIGVGFWAECKVLERSFYEGIDWMEAARFYRKEVFEKLSGYDEKLTGPEDYDLPQRLKAKYGNDSIGRISSYIFHNEGSLSLTKTLRKKYYYGKRVPLYMKKKTNVQYGLQQGSIIARFNLFFSKPRMLYTKPLVSFGMLFMKLCEMGALGVGYIVGKMTL